MASSQFSNHGRHVRVPMLQFNDHSRELCILFDEANKQADLSIGRQRYSDWGKTYMWTLEDYATPGFHGRYIENLYFSRCVEGFELANQILQQLSPKMMVKVKMTDVGGGPGNAIDAIARWCEWKFERGFLHENFTAVNLEAVAAWKPAMDILSRHTPNISFELAPESLMEMLDNINMSKDHLNVISLSHIISDFLPKCKSSRFWLHLATSIKAAQGYGVVLILDRFSLDDRLSDCMTWYSVPSLGGRSKGYIGLVNFEMAHPLVKQPLVLTSFQPPRTTVKSDREEANVNTKGPTPLFWGTDCGECFHMSKECFGLRSAGLIIKVTESGRKPCKVCCKSLLKSKQEETSVESRESTPVLWGTSKGECFHVSKGCFGLRSARSIIEVDKSGRRPCKVCCKGC